MPRPPQGSRQDPREVVELRALAQRQPDLSAAVSLQIELIDALRRMQVRIATMAIPLAADEVVARLSAGRPLIDFDGLPVEWTEARLLFRQVTDVLRRHDAVDRAAAARLHDVGRGPTLVELARRWFEKGRSDSAIEMLDDVLAWAMRPFLVRAADVLQQRDAFGIWKRGTCPVCGGEPDFACITATSERLLICGRCQTRWPTEPVMCPFCGERAHQRIVSFATPDGIYRVTACQTCLRYVKTLDGRRAGRAVMPVVDTIATLPLDAVVMQRGFSNG